MSPTIRIGDDVYEHLQQHAEPFVDTPDSVLRRLLGLADGAQEEPPAGDHSSPAEPAQAARAEHDGPPATTAAANGAGKGMRSTPARASKSRARHGSPIKRGSSAARAPRAPRGSLMKDAVYELPILQVLAERGGRAGKNEVLDALEPLLGEQLTDLDRTPLASGEIRWRNRAQFVRLRLVQRGEMENDSPRGIWELAEPGRARLESSGAAASQAGAR
jgi:hypothetical protein